MDMGSLYHRNPDTIEAICYALDHGLTNPGDLYEIARSHAAELGNQADTGRRTLDDLVALGIIRISRHGAAHYTGLGEAWRHHQLDDVPVLRPYINEAGATHPTLKKLTSWAHYRDGVIPFDELDGKEG